MIQSSFKKVSLLICALALVVTCQGRAQFAEDALRFSTLGIGVGARAMGMGGAYTGIANDYSALYWNPAGLAQLEHGEFSFGMTQFSGKDNSNFFGKSGPYTNSATNLNALGLAFPLQVRRGSAVLAFGFNRQSNFTAGLSFNGFNPNSSIIQYWAPDGKPYPKDITLAEDLYLASADTVRKVFRSPIKNRVTQLGQVLEGGGLNNWSVGGAIEAGKNIFVGATLTYVSGKYTYDRNYKEQDNNRLYTARPFDFDQLIVDDNIEDEITGVSGKLGLLFREPNRFRVGVAVKTPTSLHVKETFGTSAASFFDTPDSSGASSYGPFDSNGSSEYDILTPWVFSIGGSVILREFLVSADIDYADWTSIEFRNANDDLLKENRRVKQVFRATANLRLGAEYDIAQYGMRVRAGFNYNPSPFQGDPSSFDQKYLTAGLGVLLGESTMLDLGYMHGWWRTYRVNYDSTSRVDEAIYTNNFTLTFAYRF